jgi:hypothetical protein
MKISKLNLGQPLTKDQQKQIKGGSGVCSTSQRFRCTCTGNNPRTVCISGDGVSDANALCTNYCYPDWITTHVANCNDPACSGEGA